VPGFAGLERQSSSNERLAICRVQNRGRRRTDREAVGKAIREGTFTVPGYAYPLSWTEWGELKQATPILYTFEQGDPGQINPGATWRPKVLSRSPVLPPYTPQQ